MRLPKRDYHHKEDTSRESRMFWIMTAIGLAIAFAIIFLF